MDQKRQSVVTFLAEKASVLLWITGGDLFKSRDPEFATVLGLARTLMLERPSLKMPVLDLERSSITFDKLQACKQVTSVLNEVLQDPNPDLEFRVHDNALYISRFVPDLAQNVAFRRTQDAEKVHKRISDVGRAKLGLQAVGQVDTLRFEQTVQ
jgi:hypothetical protein